MQINKDDIFDIEFMEIFLMRYFIPMVKETFLKF